MNHPRGGGGVGITRDGGRLGVVLIWFLNLLLRLGWIGPGSGIRRSFGTSGLLRAGVRLGIVPNVWRIDVVFRVDVTAERCALKIGGCRQAALLRVTIDK